MNPENKSIIMSYKSRVSRERNPHTKDDAKEKSFFSKQKKGKDQNASNAFFQAKLSVNKPGDSEKEADHVADTVTNKNITGTAVPLQKVSSIQRLATPIDYETLGTNDAKIKKDKEIQKKPMAADNHASETEKKKEQDDNKTHQSPGQGSWTTNDGVCMPGTSTSACADDVGYYIVSINNDCCTRPCTIDHEKIHVADMNDCCKKYHRALKQEGLSKEEVTEIKEKWDKWEAAARQVSECKAYTNDVTCAKKMAEAQGCNSKKPVAENSEETPSENPSEAPSEVVSDTTTDKIADNGIEESESGDNDDDVTAQEPPLEIPTGPEIKDQSKCCREIAKYGEAFKLEAGRYCDPAAGKKIPPCPFDGKSKKGPIKIPN